MFFKVQSGMMAAYFRNSPLVYSKKDGEVMVLAASAEN